LGLGARRRRACGDLFIGRKDERIRGAPKAAKFRAFEVAIKYMTAMRWLDGGSGMREAVFDAWLTALLVCLLGC
jgi:hypothetical protein